MLSLSVTHERAGGPQEMNHSGACEVSEVSRAVEPAGRVPGPVRDGRVDAARDEDGVHEVGHELTSLRDGPGHDGGRGGREDELEHTAGTTGFIIRGGVSTGQYLEEPFRVGIIGELVVEILRSSTEQITTSTVGQTPAQGPVRQSSNEGVQHVFYQNVDGVLGSDRPGFQESKAALHEENNDGHDHQEELVTFSSQALSLMFCLVQEGE